MMSSYKIISVCIVKGNTLQEHWSDNMQKIYADPEPKGEHKFYIGTMLDKNGFPWYDHVGKDVPGVTIYDSKGFQWMSKA